MQELIWLARCKLILVSSHWAWLLSWSPSAQSISRAPRSIQDWDERSHCDLHIIINLTTTQRCLVSQLFVLFSLCVFIWATMNQSCACVQRFAKSRTHKNWFTNYDFHMCKSQQHRCLFCVFALCDGQGQVLHLQKLVKATIKPK